MYAQRFTENERSVSLTTLPLRDGVGSTAVLAGLVGVEAAPFLHAAWLFALGIYIAQWEWFRPSWALIAFLLLGGVCLFTIFRARRLMGLALAVVWCLLGVWCAEMEPHPASAPALSALSDGLIRTVEGTVVDAGSLHGETEQNIGEPMQAAPSQRLDIQLATIEFVDAVQDKQVPVEGRARLEVRWPVEGMPTVLHCGDRIRAEARLLIPASYHDPGVWSRSDALLDQGVTATAKVNGRTVERIGVGNSGALLGCRLSEVQRGMSARLVALPAAMRRVPLVMRLSPEDAAMLAAMVTGDRSYLTHTMRIGFERTGSFHMLVVSGFHLAIVAACIFWLMRRVRMPQLPATLVTLAASLGYALFTGFATPVQRSLWMVSVYMIGRLLYRQRSPLNTIGFAALCLLAASPRSLLDASFQMTLLSVLAIAGIAYPLLRQTIEPYRRATKEIDLVEMDAQYPQRVAEFRLFLRTLEDRWQMILGWRIPWQLMPIVVGFVLRWFELLVVGIVVELALTLPMAIYFHRLTVFALPTNLLIMSLLAFLVPFAMVTMALLVIWPAAAILPAMPTAFILHTEVGRVQMFSNIAAGDLRVATPLAAQSLLFCFLVAAAMWLATGGKGLRRLCWAALICAAFVVLVPRAIEHPHDALLMEAIDVGQGDSLLLITPDGKTLLVDGGGFGGGPRQAPQEFDIGEEVVSAALWSRGIRHLDVVALSHAHSDHMGGLPAVLRNFHPTELWVGNNPPVAAYQGLLDEAHHLGVQVRPMTAGDHFRWGAASVQVFAPLPGYVPGAEPMNNDSLVLRVAYGATSVLLEGDAEAPVERAMLNEPGLQSTLLKVGHHGSITSSQPEFLARVAPSWAVISCGLHNRYHHPREEILAELEAAHVRTLSTDINGATCFRLDGKQVTLLNDCARTNGH